MIITELKEQERSAWDNYVANSPDGLPFHLSGWSQVLSRTYKYDTAYLMARSEGRVVGVLPLFAVRSLVTGRVLTTPPGGLCADDEEVALALVEEGRAIAGQMKLDSLVLHDTRQNWSGSLDSSSHHEAWITNLCEDAETQWQQINRNVRRQVRMARENKLESQSGFNDRLVDDFYRVMSRFTHEAGTPVFGFKFLQNVVEAFPGQASLLAVYKDGQVLGSYLSMVLGKTVFGLWGASLREHLPLRVSYLAYWEMLRTSIEQGLTRIDMGRSPAGSGASQFKSRWGGYSVPVYQQVARISRRASREAIAGRVRTDRRYRGLTRIWSWLPLPLTRVLGPRLRRHVPFA